MSPETEAFLESVRGAEDPTPEDEQRVLRAVQATIAAGTLIGTAAATSKLTRLWTWAAGGSFKANVSVLALCAAAAGGVATLTGAFTPHVPSRQLHDGVAGRAPLARRPSDFVSASPRTALPPARNALPPARSSPEPMRRPPLAVRAAPSRPAPEPSSAMSLRDELAVLARAQAALRQGDGARALSALDAAPGREPQLAAERATLRILALCALGRAREARRDATDLERLEPGSLQRDVISRSCAGSPDPPRR